MGLYTHARGVRDKVWLILIIHVWRIWRPPMCQMYKIISGHVLMHRQVHGVNLITRGRQITEQLIFCKESSSNGSLCTYTMLEMSCFYPSCHVVLKLHWYCLLNIISYVQQSTLQYLITCHLFVTAWYLFNRIEGWYKHPEKKLILYMAMITAFFGCRIKHLNSTSFACTLVWYFCTRKSLNT